VRLATPTQLGEDDVLGGRHPCVDALDGVLHAPCETGCSKLVRLWSDVNVDFVLRLEIGEIETSTHAKSMASLLNREVNILVSESRNEFVDSIDRGNGDHVRVDS
jgi:hypothetical protein